MIPRRIKIVPLEIAHTAWFIYVRLKFIVIFSYYYILKAIEERNKTCDKINVSTKDLKVPKHIALSLTNETNNLDIESIARLLCWCKQLSISFITLYDDAGRLKDLQMHLIKHVERRMKLMGYEKPIHRIEGLNIISRVDGRQKFVEDVRQLAKLRPEKIDLEVVNNRVCWPTDPELLISFGSPLCLYGFPPWQLRLTEILSIPTHRNMPQKIFIDCFRRYAKTTQREGV